MDDPGPFAQRTELAGLVVTDRDELGFAEQTAKGGKMGGLGHRPGPE
jgi:hypothetical protein